MSAKNFLRRDLPILLIIIFAAPVLLSRYISDPLLTSIQTELGFWASLISMIAWGLGIIYLFQGEYHAMKMKPGLIQKVYFGILVGFSALLVCLSILYADFSTGKLGLNSAGYAWWYLGFYKAQSTAFYALMFLYLMSASYRMLRFRNLEVSVLLVSGLIYLMRNTSLFTLYFPWLVPTGEWIMNYPNAAASSAAVISMAMGSVLIGARQLLGRERTAVEVAS